MGIPHYLAMTSAELAHSPPAQHTAWLSCHFSPYGGSVSNLPPALPADSLLILDDSTPIHGHDPEAVADTLKSCLTEHGCRGLLLDFQRPEISEEQEMAAYLLRKMECPVGISHLYAKELDCPVFLPPVPPQDTLQTHLKNWTGREVWLETALNGLLLTLTEDGCRTGALPSIPDNGLEDGKLHCHYQAELLENAARFSLWRTRDDLETLLEEAERMGVTMAVGLWQELGR